MKRSLLVIGAAVALIVAWSVGRAQGQQDSTEKVLFVSADQATFSAMNPGVSGAAIWGDSNTGAHGTFTKFEPGYAHPHERCVDRGGEGRLFVQGRCRGKARRAG